jgi:hypothetical protein
MRAKANIQVHPQRRHYLHTSFGIVDGGIYAVGMNRNANPPVHFGYHTEKPTPKVHSELDAYRKLRKVVSLARTDWSLVNVRVSRTGHMRMSKPCQVCQGWLAAIGCTEVAYTTEDGWQTLRLK